MNTTSSPNLHFRDAIRLHRSVLARAEKRLLVWIAQRMPAWINSDHLTFLGLIALAAAGASYWYASRNLLGLWLVIICLAVNWFGDSLDGTLARVRNRQRPRYGFYVDHILDAFGTFFLIGGMSLSGFLSWKVASLILITYFMLSIEVYLATYTLGAFRISFGGFGPTELRIVIAIGNLALLAGFRTVNVFGIRHPLFDVGGSIAIVGIVAMLLVTSIRHARALYLQEKLP